MGILWNAQTCSRVSPMFPPCSVPHPTSLWRQAGRCGMSRRCREMKRPAWVYALHRGPALGVPQARGGFGGVCYHTVTRPVLTLTVRNVSVLRTGVGLAEACALKYLGFDLESAPATTLCPWLLTEHLNLLPHLDRTALPEVCWAGETR